MMNDKRISAKVCIHFILILDHMSNLQSNMLYIQENLIFLPQGKDMELFNFHDDRVLTMNGRSRSVWKRNTSAYA